MGCATWFRGTKSCFLLILLAGVALAEGSEPGVKVAGLRCEYRSQPLSIDTPVPRLSWQLESTLRGQKQIAYRVVVARTPETLQEDRGDLWDSGRVTSNQSVNVPYEGKPLISGQRCFWKVMVWGREGAGSAWSDPSFWEMGLLEPRAWQGSWISDGKPLPGKDADFFKDDPAPLFRREFKVTRAVRMPGSTSAPWDTLRRRLTAVPSAIIASIRSGPCRTSVCSTTFMI